MRFQSSSILLSSLGLLHRGTTTTTTSAFQIQPHSFSSSTPRQRPQQLQQYAQQQKQWLSRRMSWLKTSAHDNVNLHEFEYLLHEDSSSLSTSTSSPSSAITASSRRRLLVVPGSGNSDYRFTISTSSLAAPSSITAASEEEYSTSSLYDSDQEGDRTTASDYDPYAESIESQLGKIHQFQEQKSKGFNLEERLNNMDLVDIVATLIIPAIVAFAGIRWTFNRIAAKVEANAEATLNSFANEMIYHDGDYDEMRLCVSDFSRRLVWMGPAKGDAMLKRYLEMYAKKKTVNPRAISSLSYVFTLFKLSEERAAQVLVSLCRQMGTDRISSAGKLLFFGSRILKSPEGKAALTPIKDLIKSTYRDATVAESLIETSQHAIAEAAYRATVQAGGRDQTTLTVGWEVLGLDRETATRIFEEEKKEGFVTAREAMYGLQTQKYDKKGNRITDDGKLANPEDAEGGAGDFFDEDETDSSDDNSPTSNVYECSECGYTLFIAQGRESKFFGPSFKCPECGAPKDKFKGRNIGEDDE